MESRKVAALETFLEKYPDTPKRQEIQNIIGNVKRAEFTEWTLFEIGNQRIPWYVQLSSIVLLKDRASIAVQYLIDPNSARMFFGRSLPSADYGQDVAAYDCDKPRSATSEQTILDKSKNTLYHYKFAEPRYLDLSVGAEVSPGSVGDSIRNLACNESLGMPMISKDRLTKMNFKSVSSTVAGDGDIFFELLQDQDDNSSNEKNLLFILRFYDDRKVSLAPTVLVDAPIYRIEVDKVRVLCAEKKMASTKSEYYDTSNRLVYLTALDPRLSPTNWINIDNGTQSPLTALHRIVCNSGEATK